MRVPEASRPQQYSLSVFVILAILMGAKLYLVVLICISLMTNDAEHVFMCLLALWGNVYANLLTILELDCLHTVEQFIYI